jgi:hypothetical protein
MRRPFQEELESAIPTSLPVSARLELTGDLPLAFHLPLLSEEISLRRGWLRLWSLASGGKSASSVTEAFQYGSGKTCHL